MHRVPTRSKIIICMGTAIQNSGSLLDHCIQILQLCRQADCDTMRPKIPQISKASLLFARLLLLGLLLHGCAGHRATEAEKALLPEAGLEKYWLFNQITTLKGHHTLHDCLLLTQSPGAQGTATSLFISQWDSRDSSFHYGMQTSLGSTISKPGRWPMLIQANADSLGTGWRWFWDRHSIWVDGALANGPTQPYVMHGKFWERKPYSTTTALASPSIIEIEPFSNNWNTGDSYRERHAMANLAIFSQASSLVEAGNAQAVYWIKLGLAHDDYLSLLLQIDAAGKLEVRAQNYHGTATDWENLSFQVAAVPTSVWASPHSRKKYTLGFTLTTPQHQLEIHPRSANQEIPVGKKSFWMGAIEATDLATGKALSRGNMYIFTH